MNRRTYQFHSAFEAQTVALYMNVVIGAMGDPTLTANQNKGITSITRTGTGAYTIVLQDQYTRILSADMTSIVATTPAAPDLSIVEDDSADTTPSIDIQLSLNGVAADAASGEVLLIHLQMKNSSI